MRNLKFHYLRAENILCFGPLGVEFHFADYGAIVQIIGINLDMPASENVPASNASGKSSMQELLSIGLYGRTVKSPTKNKGMQIVNTLATSGSIDLRWDDYRVLRTYKKSSAGSVSCKLELWKSSDHIWDDATYITQTSDQTNAEIEKALGLTHHAFCNVVIFDDSSTYSFLEADADTKRTIVENLLDLDQYRGYHQNCKELLKTIKTRIDSLTKEYSLAQSEVDACIRRITTIEQQDVTWKQTKTTEIVGLKNRIIEKQKKLETSDDGKQLANWNAAQERLVTLADEITDLESKRQKVEAAVEAARKIVNTARGDKNNLKENISVINSNLIAANQELDKNLALVTSLESKKEGTPCPYCYGIINRDNYGEVLISTRHKTDECRAKIAEELVVITTEKEKLEKKSAAIGMMEQKLTEAQSKIALFENKIRINRKEILDLSKLSKPQGNAAEQVLEAEIVELKKQLTSKEQEAVGQSPYKEILEQAEAEKINKELEREQKVEALREMEAEAPYYQFWLEAFSDKGIRKFVIDGIIPALNSRVAYWMQILSNGLIEVEFDNRLEQSIKRNNNVAAYHNMSNGERRRVNLAVSQAFAYVMTLNSGTCPSLVFLDEVTGGGIDRAGIPGVHNMIFELAKERQVFVTTHNESLMNLLQGCETITLKKRDDITTLVP